jgi:hypothetical protein
VKRRRLAIIGLGKVGLARGTAIAASEDLAVAGHRAAAEGPSRALWQGLTTSTDDA